MLEAKLAYGSKVGAFTKNHTKFLSFNSNDLEHQGQGHQFYKQI